MRFSLTLVFLFVLFIVVKGSQNNIEVVDFKKLEPRLHKSNDTTYIVNFWATWCIPCRKELPDFEKIGQDYSDKKVKILLVSLDFPGEIQKSLLPFLQKSNIKSEVVLLDDTNSNYWISRVDPDWNGNIPATLIYNKTYREFFAQMLSYDQINSILTSKI